MTVTLIDAGTLDIPGWTGHADNRGSRTYYNENRTAQIQVRTAEFSDGTDGFLADLWMADTPHGVFTHSEQQAARDVLDLRTKVNILLGHAGRETSSTPV